MARTKALRVTFIAPIEPFRSGVAKHSTQVALELKKREDIELTVYSFDRLYPSLFFPGSDDKDGSTGSQENVNCIYNIDAINPLNWLKVARSITSNQTDIVIVPSWTFFVAPCLGFITRQCRNKGIEIITLVHNAFDHEMNWLKTALMRYQLSKCKKFLVHNQTLATDIAREFPEVEIAISPHPIFDQYPRATKNLERKASLELLFFGIIRDYKGLDILIDAFAELRISDVRLTIVGECWGKWEKYHNQINRLNLTDRIETHIQYASDEDAANYFARSDAVVLPYRSMTGTGVIPLAYHYETPVICSNLPAFFEVVEDKKTGVIAAGNSSKDIAEAIEQFATLKGTVDFAGNTNTIRQLFTWKKYCDELVNLLN